jgi:hypothetical protein
LLAVFTTPASGKVWSFDFESQVPGQYSVQGLIYTTDSLNMLGNFDVTAITGTVNGAAMGSLLANPNQPYVYFGGGSNGSYWDNNLIPVAPFVTHAGGIAFNFQGDILILFSGPNGNPLSEGLYGQAAQQTIFGTLSVTEISPAVVEVIEYYNASQDHYFITWIANEIAILDAGVQIKGWQRTGYWFLALPTASTGTSDICRFYIPPADGDSHFYGRGSTECAATAAAHPDFIVEDPKFMAMYLPAAGVCPANTTEVFRVFDNRIDANHRYMTDKTVRDQMVAKGWVAEGDGPDLVVMCAPQ